MQISQNTKTDSFDLVRKWVFTGCNSIGYGAAGYLVWLAFLTVQQGSGV